MENENLEINNITSPMIDEHDIVEIIERTPNLRNIGKLIRGDTNSNIITFKINRYYDNVDLSTKKIRFIIKNENDVFAEDGVNIECDDNILNFSWIPSRALTYKVGEVIVVIEFYDETDNEFNYSLKTLPFSITIQESLDYTDINCTSEDNSVYISPIPFITVSKDGNVSTLTVKNKDESSFVEIIDGTNGITPHIDEDTKHWFVGETDTGVVAQGEDGKDGKDGRSIQSVTNDENDNIVIRFDDNTEQVISKIDVSADFLTLDGFGNLRCYNGRLQYYNTESEQWIDVSATSDNTYIMHMIPNPMKSISAKYNKETTYAEIKFTEPDDTYLDGQLLCAIKKIVLVRKKDSEPQSIQDGTAVLELPRRDFGKYRDTAFIDTSFVPEDGSSYYYKAFPISTFGYSNDFSENTVIVRTYTLYGFKIDQNESDPASMITYLEDCDNVDFNSAYMDYENDTFNYGDWGDAWFIKDLKPCMLKYDGTVDYELDKNDYTKKLDGSDSDVSNEAYEGNAMVGIPKVYWKIVDNDDDTMDFYFSDKKVDSDFVCWSHIDNNGAEIPYCYMSVYDGILNNNVARSISGKTPMTDKTADQEIAYAKANNVGSDVIWYTGLTNDYMLICYLLMLIGKSTDTQTVFGRGRCGSYYSDSNHGIKDTGTLNNKGLFYGNNGDALCVKVFGIENFYGNIQKRIGGWIVDNGTQKIKLTYGQSDGSTVNGYNTTGSGYISIPNSTPVGTTGYISKMIASNNCLIPTIASGSATTYYCDLMTNSNSGIMYTLIGGAIGNGTLSGAFQVNLGSRYSVTFSTAGTAISCKPLAQT